MKSLRLFTALTVLSLSACASNPNSPYDPYEPFNRSMYSFNTSLDRNVLKPAAEGYRMVTPRPLRTAVGNFYGNLQDVFSILNNTLRAEPEKALNDLMRVSINSTFGLFGLIDIATPAGLVKNRTTLGDTFATWGWKQSDYLMLPFFGPSTVRDSSGLGVSLAIPGPEKLVYSTPTEAVGFYGLYGINERERLLGLEKQLDESSLDAYTFTRDAYMQMRAKKTGTQLPQDPDDEEINIDDLVGDPQDPAASAPAASTQPLPIPAPVQP
ncbi:MlaA family lipoprotein [Craterilacuibacter sp.]|uniref:MlaA family lipoprotein n=1 Tax=Craterilacuibacter sp. TaxID=2870909 RepID=UPI003F2D0502